MRILSKEEVDSMAYARVGYFTKIRAQLDLLEPLTALLIELSDWKVKTPPNTFIAQSYRSNRSNKKFSVRTLADKKGWVVTRIK